MKRILKKALASLNLKIVVNSYKNKLLSFGLSNNNCIHLENKNIFLKDFDIEINPNTQYFIIEGYKIMSDLKEKCGAFFFTDSNKNLCVQINNITYIIQTYEEFFILNEIFISGVYNISCDENFHLIDIGMNVGYTSLYFAEKPNCISVHSYEPFKPTFSQALNNLSLNSKIIDKITPFNYGLGNKKETISVNYNPNIKGNMGINGIPVYLEEKDSEIINEEILIEDATLKLNLIIDQINSKNEKIILKMDCEGSEYNIFQSLSESKIIEHFNFIILEWHIQGPDQLIEILKKHKFTNVSFTPYNKSAGMIYAFKN